MFKNNYHKRHFFAMLQMMLMPFMGFITRSIVDEGGGGSGTSEGEEKQNELLVKIQSKVKDLITDSMKGTVTKDELGKKVKEINKSIADSLNDEQIKTLKSSVDEMVEATRKNTLELKELREGKLNSDSQPKTFRDALKDAFMEKKDICLTEKNDDDGKRLSLKEFFTEKGNQTSPKFTLKVAVDMLQSNIAQSEINLVRLTELDPNRVGIPLTIYPHVFNWIPSKKIRKAYMSVLVVYSYEDGSGTKTEGSASSKSSFLLKTVEFKAFYNATFFTISDETLDDLDEVMDEIAIVAPDKILDSIDGKVLGTTGDGSTDIKGLFATGNHTDFATATYTGTVEGANIIDLISKAKLQCEGNKYRPNIVLMNPTDIEGMGSLKNLEEDSVTDRRVRWDTVGLPAFVMGMRIIASTGITADTLAVIDQKQLVLGIRRDMSMEIGHNAADLTEGQKTVVIKVRNAFGIRDIAGVIYSDGIAVDVAAIESGV